MIGLYIFPFCWALGACFLELLNLEVIQRGMDMNWQEYNLTLLSSSQPVVPSASSYDWVSTGIYSIDCVDVYFNYNTKSLFWLNVEE